MLKKLKYKKILVAEKVFPGQKNLVSDKIFQVGKVVRIMKSE